MLFLSTIIGCAFSNKTNMKAKKNNTIECGSVEGICKPGDRIKAGHDIAYNTTSKIKLKYYYDALCGWCYGFSEVMSKIEQDYGDKLDIEVISGGLFLGNRAGRINDVAPHIKNGAYKIVERRTGVKFGKVFLSDVFGEGKTILNSLLPTIALCIVREEFPEEELRFAKLLLKAVYFDGLNPIDLDGLAAYAVKIGCNKEVFLLKMKEDKYRQTVEKEFQLFRNSEYNGMPTLVIEQNGNQTLISNGYAKFEELKLILEPFFINC